MPGSMRKRGDSWELRVYAGTDPETGRDATGGAPRRGALAALRSERSSSSQPALTIH